MDTETWAWKLGEERHLHVPKLGGDYDRGYKVTFQWTSMARVTEQPWDTPVSWAPGKMHDKKAHYLRDIATKASRPGSHFKETPENPN